MIVVNFAKLRLFLARKQRTKQSQRRLLVENLETRQLLFAPNILWTAPGDLATDSDASFNQSAQSAEIVTDTQHVRFDVAGRIETVLPASISDLDESQEILQWLQSPGSAPILEALSGEIRVDEKPGDEKLGDSKFGDEDHRSDVSPATVHGNDDRFQITNTTSFPYSAIGRLDVGYSTGAGGLCSGAMVGAFHFLTAGHCVYDPDEGGWATDLTVSAGKIGSDRPFGEANWQTVHSYTGWTNDQSPDHDWALIALDRNLGNFTGWLGYESRGNSSDYNAMTVNTAGYPGDLSFGQNMYGANGPTDSATDNRVFYSGSNGMDTAGGQSGSSVWRYDATADDRFVNAVHAYGGPTQNSGTRINSTKYNSLQTWIADDTTNLSPIDRPDWVDADTWDNSYDGYFSRSTIAPGESFFADTLVLNKGTANGTNVDVRFRLSTDSNYGTNDTLLGDATLANVSAMGSAYASISSTLPSVTDGTYYLVWQIDPFGSSVEFDESNNTGSLSTPIIVSNSLFSTDIGDTVSTSEPTSVFTPSDAYSISTAIGDNNAFPTGDVDMFSLYADAGTTITAFTSEVPGGISMDTGLRLFDANGSQVAQNDDFGSLYSRIEFSVTAPGTYYVGVSAYPNFTYDPFNAGTGSSLNTGDYQLDIALSQNNPPAPDIGGTILNSESTSVGTTTNFYSNESTIGDTPNPSTDVDMYQFSGAAGSVITITTSNTLSQPSFDGYLRLFDHLGNQLASNDNVPGSLYPQITYTLPASSGYYVGVSGAGNNSYNPFGGTNGSSPETGGYEIQIQLSIPPAPGVISGHKWNDLNGDSVEDDGEPRMAGWQVYLDLNDNGSLSPGEPTTFTTADDPATPAIDETGFYEFADLAPGQYFVAEVQPPGWSQTYPGPTSGPLNTSASGTSSNAVTTSGSLVATERLGVPIGTESFNQINSQTSQSGSLINLSTFRGDARFAGIDGGGMATVIMDTGIDLDHPFFGPDVNNDGVADRIVHHQDFTGEGDDTAQDVDGHGSNVASIMTSQDVLHTGMAPGADIIALQVLDNSGGGNFGMIESALQWVLANASTYNIGSINMSLGDSANYNTSIGQYGINDELAALEAAGVIVVSAAGNSFFEFNSVQGVSYPAADPNSLAISAVWDSNNGGPIQWGGGATDNTTGGDRITSFSQRHATLTDVMAPGAFIVGAGANGGTISYGGTSQAAPHVAGLAVLAQQVAQQYLGRNLIPAEFKTLLQTTGPTIIDGDDEDDNVTNTNLSFQRIDMLALAEAILVLDAPAATPGDEVWSVTINPGQHVENVSFASQLLTSSLTVTTTADSGPGSLRDAITTANGNAGPDIITFDIPGPGPHLISLSTQLPAISDPVTIDGTTEPDYTGAPVVQINAIGNLNRGLWVLAGGAGSALVGLSVTGFERAGIELTGVTNTTIADNYLGLDPDGNASANFQGLRIINATDNLIDGNVISGNDNAGAFVNTTTIGNNTFTSNYVGSDPTGLLARPNGTDGISLRSPGNTVGLPGQGNLVSGNTRWGVYGQTAGRGGNTIQANTIGLDSTQTAPLSNLIGVRVTNENNQIGGDASGQFNVISGNSAHGLEIAANTATGNVVHGNRIGTDALGQQDLGNGLFGVRLISAPNNFLGGSGPGQGNVISGNEMSGVIAAFIDADNNEIVGNKIGTSLDGSTAIGNGEDGIRLVQRASGNLVSQNQISANGSRGVATDLAFGSNDNEIRSNFIGTNADGTAAMHNGTGGGVRVLAPGTIIEGNTISAPDAGILAAGNATDLLIQDNFIGVTPLGATTDLGTKFGILFGGPDIARDTLITGNEIANHTRGIRINAGTGIELRNNSIHSNTIIGIDLGVDNTTANDPGDADTGPNNLQNNATSLVVTATPLSQTAVNIQFDYQVDSLVGNAAYPLTVEFFLSDSSGQGIHFLTSDVYMTPGTKTFNQTFNISSFPFIPEFGTATVTDAEGNTSEFSDAVAILIPGGGSGQPLSSLAATPSAVYDALDVNEDRRVTAVDVLQVINKINRPTEQSEPIEASSGLSRLDVNGDGSVTALDALIIINELNADEPADPTDEVFADWDQSLENEEAWLLQLDDLAVLF